MPRLTRAIAGVLVFSCAREVPIRFTNDSATMVSVIRVEAGGAHVEGRRIAPFFRWEGSIRPTRESSVSIEIERGDGTVLSGRGGYLEPRLARIIEITLGRSGELEFQVVHDSGK